MRAGGRPGRSDVADGLSDGALRGGPGRARRRRRRRGGGGGGGRPGRGPGGSGWGPGRPPRRAPIRGRRTWGPRVRASKIGPRVSAKGAGARGLSPCKGGVAVTRAFVRSARPVEGSHLGKRPCEGIGYVNGSLHSAGSPGSRLRKDGGPVRGSPQVFVIEGALCGRGPGPASLLARAGHGELQWLRGHMWIRVCVAIRRRSVQGGPV